MKLKLKKGTTSKLLRIFIQDSSKTDGSGLTGLVYNSGSLTWYYIREGDASATAVTLATMTVGTFASGGFKEVDATNLPGVYEIGVPNASLATGSNSVVMMLKGATNMTPVLIEIELDAVDYQAATNFGLSALPTANPAASGGLPTVDASNGVKVSVGTGAGQVNASSGGVPVSDKTGFKLATDGLDTISTSAPAGVASNFREMSVQIWRRFFKKHAKDNSGKTIKCYADDGTTTVTTQTYTDDGAGNEVVNAAS